MSAEEQPFRPSVSDAELDRRRRAVREALVDEGLDALVAFGISEHVHSYVRYLTGVPPYGGYPDWLVLTRESELTYVTHGAFDGDTPGGEFPGAPYGVDRVLTTAAFASARITAEYEPALVARALGDLGAEVVGLAGLHQMPHRAVEYLRRELSGMRFVDASELLDRLKADKSPEELELIRRTAHLQDEAMRAAFAAVEPGMHGYEVVEVAQRRSLELGSEHGLCMFGSAPIGEPAIINVPHLQRRRIEAGDVVVLLIENAGPGGYYGELARTCVLGEAPQSMHEGFAQVLAAQEACVETIAPGSDPLEIWQRYNADMTERGLPVETRLHCHGQGLDMVERPLVRFDETLPIGASTFLACHPATVVDGHFNFICDNFLFDEAGRMTRVHQFPAELVEK